MCMLPRRQPYQHPATVVVERQQKEEEEEASLDTSDNWISLSSKDPGFSKRDSPSGFPWTG